MIETFKDVIGQEKIIAHLQSAIRTGKVSHAYIINGSRGSGKLMMADLFARTLQCEKGDVEPCMVCRSCRQAIGNNQPDVIHITKKEGKSIPIQEIREQIVGDAQVKPYSSKYKIYIIEDADELNAAAQNALLKTLEEPPAYAVFILLTSNAKRLLPTILSRCVELDLQVVSNELVMKCLQERFFLSEEQSAMIAAFAQGNIGKAIAAATSEDFLEMKEQTLYILQRLDQMRMEKIAGYVTGLERYMPRIEEYFDMMEIWFRDVLCFKASRDMNALVFKDQMKYISERASASSYEGLETILQAIEVARTRIRASVKFNIVMELLFSTMKEN